MLRFFSCIVLIALSGCSEEKQSSAIIDWRGGSTIETLDWKFNGKSIGHGEQGFASLLSRLDNLEDGAYLKVHYPLGLWNITLPDYNLSDPFPFKRRDDLRQKFVAIMIKKRMMCQEFSEPENGR